MFVINSRLRPTFTPAFTYIICASLRGLPWIWISMDSIYNVWITDSDYTKYIL